MRNHISGHIDHTVMLGQAGYGDALTITQSGRIVPAYSMLPQAGADGIDIAARIEHARILNQGAVLGAAGSKTSGVMAGQTGGLGIDFSSAGRLDNQGTVAGGAGGSNSYAAGAYGGGGKGGVGIHLATGAVLANAGSVSGGAGGDFYSGNGYQNKGGDGGAGINLEVGVVLTNAGIVSGGAGGYSYDIGVGNGGAGILAHGSDRLSNSGTIKGGDGGGGGGISRFYNSDVPIGVGGTGVLLGDASRLINTGLIEGGYGGGGPQSGGNDENGGVGVELSGAATLINRGTVAGGVGGDANYFNYFLNAAGGGAGVVIDASSVVINTGHISGGNAGRVYGGGSGEPGGVGVDVGTGTLNNTGIIAGGIGDPGFFAYRAPAPYDVAGGAGVTVSGGHVVNAGTIAGGAGLYGAYSPGGVGLALTSSTVSNTGTIDGGTGANAYSHGGGVPQRGGISGSAGGNGVSLYGGYLSNAGTIAGGAGGYGDEATQAGGAGGTGVAIVGGLLTNTGVIQGGQGGAGLVSNPTYGTAIGGNGGAGVYLNGGTLVTAGTIAGGLGGASMANPGAMGDAVQFGTPAGTLVVDPGATFQGAIVANANVDDTLVLAGTASGTLTGFGTSITGFTTITEDAHANWALGGAISGGGALDIGAGAVLTLDGAVSIASIAFAAGGETLHLALPGQVTSIFAGFAAGDVIDLETLTATSLRYGHGTLTLFDGRAQVDTLHFAGALTSSDFGVVSDGHGGTDVVFETSPFGGADAARASSICLTHEPSPSQLGWAGGHAHFPV